MSKIDQLIKAIGQLKKDLLQEDTSVSLSSLVKKSDEEIYKESVEFAKNGQWSLRKSLVGGLKKNDDIRRGIEQAQSLWGAQRQQPSPAKSASQLAEEKLNALMSQAQSEVREKAKPQKPGYSFKLLESNYDPERNVNTHIFHVHHDDRPMGQLIHHADDNSATHHPLHIKVEHHLDYPSDPYQIPEIRPISRKAVDPSLRNLPWELGGGSSLAKEEQRKLWRQLHQHLTNNYEDLLPKEIFPKQ